MSTKFSVIFASAYRFTVLFSYTPKDPSYTLAPTVGWTAIEMSAGITSACLPTLRPAFQCIARVLGIQRLMPSIFNSKSSLGLSAVTDQSNTGHGDSSTHSRKGSQHAGGGFHRLHESSRNTDTSPESSDQVPLSAKLRPDHGCVYTVTTSPGRDDGASLSGDEVPLHSIRVHTDFRQVEQ